MLSLIRILGVIVAGVLLLAGCARGTSDLQEWVAEVRRQPPEPIEPIPPIRAPEIVAYEAMDLRNPFRAGRPRADEEIAAAEGAGPRPDPERRREYLEGFPLDTLDMVGTIVVDDVHFALIRDNENVVHRVREGNHLGQNHGRVLDVMPNLIELRELVQDGRGGWMERRTRLAMAEQ